MEICGPPTRLGARPAAAGAQRCVRTAMSREQTESVVKTVESLLAEAEQLKNHCRRQNEDIKLIMEELQRENKELAQNYEQAEHEMEEMRKALSELMDTKIAFEARERQVRKLSKQL
ncbi:hypothetical protein UY3_17099 [Chelonia mydas]|uniref:Uncharacterized protein n=1 Tax=Chelonia mydas TaxID=8469 RepID=M7B147_CHEMY|nr:hypothetical protein UY3_17099 [Chelonia mydas]